jgi:hypothetical protein
MCLRLRPVLERELRQRRSAPQVECDREECAPLLGGRRARVGKHLLEAACVDLLG